MPKKRNEVNFDFDEFRNQVNELKTAAEKSKKENDKNQTTTEDVKQSLGQKIIGIIVLVVLIIGAGFLILSNLGTILLPKNSIAITVTDENGEVINGLKISISGPSIYDREFVDNSSITILKAEPGDYHLIFEEIPKGYSCLTSFDNFTLNENGKISLEYECTKEN